MSTAFIRNILISIVLAAIATAISIQMLSNTELSSSTGITILSVLFFLVSTLSSLAGANKTPNKSQKNAPKASNLENSRETGTVKWFNTNKGFGFITRDSGDDVFGHFRSIRGQGHRTLIEGQRVEFSVTEGEKGLQAEDVAIAS